MIEEYSFFEAVQDSNFDVKEEKLPLKEISLSKISKNHQENGFENTDYPMTFE